MSDQTSPALITVLLTEEEHEALVWAWYLAEAEKYLAAVGGSLIGPANKSGLG